MNPICTNPTYNRDGSIDVIYSHPTLGDILFTASQYDTEELGRTIYANAIAGGYGTIAPFVQPPAPIPYTVTKAQWGLAMLQYSLWDSFQTWLNNTASAEDKLAFSLLADINRSSPFLGRVTTALEITVTLMDNIFITANGIEV